MKSPALIGSVGLLLLAGILLVTASSKPHHRKSEIPLQDATILIIRHAEKPAFGPELSPDGERRAEAYAHYFTNFTVDSQPLRLDYLIAAADSKQSERPRLTLKPLSKALHLGINLKYEDKNYRDLVSELQTKDHGKAILICWHRGMIPDLVQALGADPLLLLPGGLWPVDQFSWVLQLRYDHQGRLIPEQTKRIQEHLLPQDPPDPPSASSYRPDTDRAKLLNSHPDGLQIRRLQARDRKIRRLRKIMFLHEVKPRGANPLLHGCEKFFRQPCSGIARSEKHSAGLEQRKGSSHQFPEILFDSEGAGLF